MIWVPLSGAGTMEETHERALTASTFAIACLTSAYAQQALITPDQRREIEILEQKYTELLNAGDAKTLVSMYTDNGVSITSSFGITRGLEGLKESAQKFIQMGLKLTPKIEAIEPLENSQAIAVIGTYSATMNNAEIRGSYLHLYERQGSNWKIRVNVGVRATPPAGTTSSIK